MHPRVLTASFLGVFAASIAAVYGAVVPAISASTGVPAATVGQLTTVHGVGAFGALLWWRRAQRRHSTSSLVVLAVGLIAAGAAAIALNPAATRPPSGRGALLVIAVTVLVVGFAFGLTMVGLNSLAARRGASASTLSALNGVYGVGAVLLPLLAGRTDLRTVAWVSAAVGAAALPWLRQAPDLRADHERAAAEGGVGRSASGPWDRLWHGDGSRPWVWLFSVAIGVEIGTAAWAPTHLVAVGVSERTAAAAVAGFFAVFAATRFVLAAVVSRLDVRIVVVAANAVAALAAAAAALVSSPVLAWVLVGVGVGPVFPTTLAWLTAVRDDPDATRKLMIGGSIGAVLLPAAIGGGVSVAGEGVIPWAIAAYAAAAAGLAATLPATDGRRPSELGAATSAHH